MSGRTFDAGGNAVRAGFPWCPRKWDGVTTRREISGPVQFVHAAFDYVCRAAGRGRNSEFDFDVCRVGRADVVQCQRTLALGTDRRFIRQFDIAAGQRNIRTK